MSSALLALASSTWGVGRFTTDIIALSAFAILISLPIRLLRPQIELKKVWGPGNALSKD